MRQTIGFLSILFSLFVLSSCHYMGGKNRYCSKKSCKEKYHSKWKKKAKKSCCGQGSIAGFSSIKGLNEEKIVGFVFFEETERNEIRVTADIRGLAPNKKFGFHVHEFGTCENKGLFAGGHLNPWRKKHAGPQAENRHLGDLGNLISDKQGVAVYSVSVKGKLEKFMGRSVIVHAKADDMKTQPTGNSGDRIACGVILASMPPVQEEKQTIAPTIEKNKAVSVKKATVPVKDLSAKKETPASPVKEVSTHKKTTAPTVSSKKEAPAVVEKAVSTDNKQGIQKANSTPEKKK